MKEEGEGNAAARVALTQLEIQLGLPFPRGGSLAGLDVSGYLSQCDEKAHPPYEEKSNQQCPVNATTSKHLLEMTAPTPHSSFPPLSLSLSPAPTMQGGAALQAATVRFCTHPLSLLVELPLTVALHLEDVHVHYITYHTR